MLIPRRRVVRQHAIIRLDVMRPISKTVPAALVLLSLTAAGQALSSEPAAAQAPPIAAKTAKAKPEAKATPPAAPRPVAEPAPDPQPLSVAQPLAEETDLLMARSASAPT